MDVWNGSEVQVANFQSQTGIAYPLLQDASAIGLGSTQFAADRDYYFVIDQTGVIRYRSTGLYGNRFNPTAIITKIDELLANPVTPVTWGKIKALFR